jgi:hypothetical protein
MEHWVLTLAVLLVQANTKLRGLSAKTLRSKLAGAPRIVSSLFHR